MQHFMSEDQREVECNIAILYCTGFPAIYRTTFMQRSPKQENVVIDMVDLNTFILVGLIFKLLNGFIIICCALLLLFICQYMRQ